MHLESRDVNLAFKLGQIVPKMGQIWDFLRSVSVHFSSDGTNLGLFKISISTFWRGAPKCTETDLKKAQIICPI